MYNFKDLHEMTLEELNKEYDFYCEHINTLYKDDREIHLRIKEIIEFVEMRKYIKINKDEYYERLERRES